MPFTKIARFTDTLKKQEIVYFEGPFDPEALHILRRVPGHTVVPRGPRADHEADATLRFAGTSARVAVEFKRRANAASAWQLVHFAHEHPDTPVLLIAGETMADAREILREHGIAVVDGLENAHIVLPGLLFHLERRRGQPRGTNPPTRLTGKAGVAAQALLLHPQRTWRVQNLAKEARVSAGLAHRVLARLETAGVVEAEGTGPNRVRQVTNPTAVLDLWAEENVERPTRTLGYLLAQTPTQLIDQLAGNLERSGIEHALTGAAAASLLAPFVTAIPVVDVWVSAAAAPDDLYRGSRADAVSAGQHIVFLQGKNDRPLAFRQRVKELWVANSFRVYADLRQDPRRGREQADHFAPGGHRVLKRAPYREHDEDATVRCERALVAGCGALRVPALALT